MRNWTCRVCTGPARWPALRCDKCVLEDEPAEKPKLIPAVKNPRAV